MEGLSGDNINSSYRSSVTKNCCAVGRIDCAPGLKYLDTPVFRIKNMNSLTMSLPFITNEYFLALIPLTTTNVVVCSSVHSFHSRIRVKNIIIFLPTYPNFSWYYKKQTIYILGLTKQYK